MKKVPILSLRSLAGCLLLALAVWFAAPGPAAAAEGYREFAQRILAQPPKGAAVAEDIERAILVSLNSYRAAKGRKPLKAASPALILAARAQAMDLLQRGAVDHGASTGHSFESRMRAMLGGPMFLPAMAENAARDRRKNLDNAAKAKGIMEQWTESAPHRKSMASLSYVSVAIGAVRRGDDVYAVQIFIGPETKTNLFQ